MKSIKSKILCIVILALVATSWSIGAISYGITHKIMHKNADEILNSVCIEKATDVNALLQEMEGVVHFVNIYATATLSEVDQLQDQDFFTRYMQELESLFSKAAQETEGAVGYYFRFSPEILTSRSGFFYDRASLDAPFKPQQVTDLSLYEPTDREHVGWYYEPVQAGKAIWMEPYENLNNGIYMFSYVLPVYHNGTLIGVAGMDFSFDFLSAFIDEISIYDSGFAYLHASDGEIVYTSHELNPSLQNKSTPYTEASAMLDNGMKLTVRINYQDIQKESRVLLVSIVVIDVILAAVFIMVTVYCADRIITPLKKLTKMARALVDGEKISELASNSKDEVGMLSRIFVETSEKLQDNMSYIKALAYRDSLTGVKNTAAYTEAVADMEKQMNRGCPQFGVVVADINDLKLINDTYGHDAGNQLIVHASRLLGGTFRYSPLFRIGGDEFVIILTGRDFEKYRQRLKQLDDMCIQDTISIDGLEVSLAMARGVAIYNPDIDRTFNDVFNHADQAMYMHKQTMKRPSPKNDI